MRYKVIVARGALAEAEAYAEYIRKHSHDDVASDLWWNGLLDAIFSLEQLPTRCPRIAEQPKFSEPMHQLLYESHRIIFQVEPERVNVLRIYHASRRPLTTASLRSRNPSDPA